MQKKIISSFGLLFLILLSTALALNAQWAKTYGGGQNDYASFICPTSDGGYVVAGSTDPTGTNNMDFVVLKLSSMGEIQWQRAYCGSDDDWATSILQTSDGGYAVTGKTCSFGSGGSDMWVLRLQTNGDIVWQKTYGTGYDDNAQSIRQTNDGGFVIAGSMETSSSSPVMPQYVCVLKLSQSGEIEWQQAYGIGLDDSASSIQQTQDGGYVVAGTTLSEVTAHNAFLILKLSPSGNIQWQKSFITWPYTSSANSVQQTNEGGYIVAGMLKYDPSPSLFYVYVLKLLSNGESEWGRAYRENDWNSVWSSASSVRQENDGGYIVSGFKDSTGETARDAWILRLNPDGNIVWQKSYGGSEDDYAKCIAPASNGGYIFAGDTKSFLAEKSDIWVVNTKSDGSIYSSCEFIWITDEQKKVVSEVDYDTNLVAIDPNFETHNTGILPIYSSLNRSLLCEESKFNLTLQASAGGTTNPPPGTHVYYNMAAVQVEAIPDLDYKFFSWTGDVPSGLENNNLITLIMSSNKSLTANFIKIVSPPVNFAGQKVSNRSLSQIEYINVLTWQANTGNTNVQKYKIYLTGQNNRTLLAELNASTFHYWHRKVERTREYNYQLIAVNDKQQESDPAYLTVR